MNAEPPRIAIIGFGFCGLMVLANILRRTGQPVRVTVFDPAPHGTGLAYSTQDAAHLLNVPAARMGAFADDPQAFFHWLQSAAGREAARLRGVETKFSATDFVPRVLYGDYLREIRSSTLAVAREKGCAVSFVTARAIAMTPQNGTYRVHDEYGKDHIADHVILATGNAMQRLTGAHATPDPWSVRSDAARLKASDCVLIIGSGLTAVDTILSLREGGFTGSIYLLSRNALLPRPHLAPEAMRPAAFPESLNAPARLSMQMHSLRNAIRSQSAQHGWQDIMEALRPHTPRLWQQLTPNDRKRFLRRVWTLWNVHRHRMPPHIWQRLQEECRNGTLHLLAVRRYNFKSSQVHVLLKNGEAMMLNPALTVNCTGPGYGVENSADPLFQSLLSQSLATPSSTGMGFAADARLRLASNFYALGAPIAGEALEATAVPELRMQAQQIAEHITSK